MPLSVWARGDSSSAANASLNASNTNQQPTTLLTFSADTNGDGTDDGDLKLDFTLDGSVDPDTVIYLDTNGDGILDTGPISFTMEFGGTLPFTSKLNGVGPNNTDLRGEEVVILTLDTGERFFFLRSFLFDPDPTTNPNAATDSQDTFDIMDDFPNGAHNLNGLFVCYLAGTQIMTPGGNVPIETLRVARLHPVGKRSTRPDPLHWPPDLRGQFHLQVLKAAPGHNSPEFNRPRTTLKRPACLATAPHSCPRARTSDPLRPRGGVRFSARHTRRPSRPY